MTKVTKTPKCSDCHNTPISHKQLIVDFDRTLAIDGTPSLHFADAKINQSLLQMLKAYKADGWRLVLSTARGQKRTHSNMTLLVCNAVEIEIMDWLRAHNLDEFFDELQIGSKPYGQFYIDDKAISAYHAHLGLFEDIKAFYKSQHFADAFSAFSEEQTLIADGGNS